MKTFDASKKLFKVQEKFVGSKEQELTKNMLNKNNNLKEDNTDNLSDQEPVCSKMGLLKSVRYYLHNTTLHGLKYLAEDKLTTPERIFFGLSFILVVILSGFFISNVYAKWSASPIIISTSAKQKLTTDIPFPAITICNLNQALKSKVEGINSSNANYTLLMSLCGLKGLNGDNTIRYTASSWSFFRRFLMDVAQPCKEMLLYCSFGSKEENCSAMFDSALTDDGLCCTFNALNQVFLLRNYSDDMRLSSEVSHGYHAIDWTPEKGYAADLPPQFYPRTAGGTGSRMGLTVIANTSSHEYYCSKSKSTGFKILVHNPAELSKVSNYGFLVTSGREARVPIEPIYQDASRTIRSLKKNVRRCLFSDEGDLVYYRTYSRKNCELECEAKILIEQCNCTLYYLPRIDPNGRICAPSDSTCTLRVQLDIESSNVSVSCASCMPGCFELSYKTSVTASTIVFGNFSSADGYPPNIFNSSVGIQDVSIIHFYYLTNTFRSTTKSEIFGFTEFLSNTGGLLGLFMGFSIFSLIELVYYITVRPYCANRVAERLQRRNAKEKSKRLIRHRKSSKKYKNELNSPVWSIYRTKSIFSENKTVKQKNSLQQLWRQQDKINNDDVYIYPYLE